MSLPRRRDSHPCHRVEGPASWLLDDEAVKGFGTVDGIRTAGLRRVVPALWPSELAEHGPRRRS